jgi:hypothetical protein
VSSGGTPSMTRPKAQPRQTVSQSMMLLKRLCCEGERRQVGPEDTSWPMHCCGNTAVKG